MTTRTGARVYRGAPPDRVDPGNCPGCNKQVGLTSQHRRRSHVGRDRRLCSFSGTLVLADDVDVLTHLPPISHFLLNADGSLKDPLPAPARRTGRPMRVVLVEEFCQECGRRMALNRDGQRRKHRQWADDPLAPWCPGDTEVT